MTLVVTAALAGVIWCLLRKLLRGSCGCGSCDACAPAAGPTSELNHCDDDCQCFPDEQEDREKKPS